MKCSQCDKVVEDSTINESIKKYKLILCKEHLEKYNKTEFGGSEIKL